MLQQRLPGLRLRWARPPRGPRVLTQGRPAHLHPNGPLLQPNLGKQFVRHLLARWFVVLAFVIQSWTG